MGHAGRAMTGGFAEVHPANPSLALGGSPGPGVVYRAAFKVTSVLRAETSAPNPVSTSYTAVP